MSLERVIDILKQFRDREGNSSEDVVALNFTIDLLYVMLTMDGLYNVKEDKTNEI